MDFNQILFSGGMCGRGVGVKWGRVELIRSW